MAQNFPIGKTGNKKEVISISAGIESGHWNQHFG
jgi:hypothetical protein